MELSLAKAERAYLKLILGGLGALVIFVLLCWGGFRFYRHWEEGHLVRRARVFLDAGDLKTASLNARRALQLERSSVAATRLIAEIAERTNDPTALEWRRKVLELNPGSIDDALALVRGAMVFNDPATAEKTLASVAQAAAQKPAFHAAIARLAEMRKDWPAAEQAWTKAVALAPNETAYRFQLALLQLNLRDASKRAAGLATLEELRREPKEAALATRALVIDGIARHVPPEQSRDLAKELQALPTAPFSDRIMYLEILREMRDPDYDSYLAKLKTEVPANPTDLASLLSWMIRNQMSAEAIAFVGSLPTEQTTKWPVPLAIAEGYAQAKDWAQLERLTKTGNWAVYDFLRHAYEARAARGQEQQLAFRQEMEAAQKATGNNPQALSILAQTVGDWGWENEAVGLLWVLTKNPETRMAALEKLYAHYAKIADTAGLFRTLTQYAESAPNDTVLNNLAQISLLLGTDVERATRTAADLMAKDPANAVYASTYAFGLLTKGDTKGALKVMDGLSADQLRNPSVATYYGLVLSAAGEKEKARPFLKRSAETTLLPEEKALVAKAERDLD